MAHVANRYLSTTDVVEALRMQPVMVLDSLHYASKSLKPQNYSGDYLGPYSTCAPDFTV